MDEEILHSPSAPISAARSAGSLRRDSARHRRDLEVLAAAGDQELAERLLLKAALKTTGRETAAMRHGSTAGGDRCTEAKKNIMCAHRTCRRLIEGIVHPIRRDEACDRLKVRHDHTHKAVVAQHAAKLRECPANLMLVQMLDAMRCPYRIGDDIGDR